MVAQKKSQRGEKRNLKGKKRLCTRVLGRKGLELQEGAGTEKGKVRAEKVRALGRKGREREGEGKAASSGV